MTSIRVSAAIAALTLTALVASPASAATPTAKVDVSIPSPGDISYAVVQVRIGKRAGRVRSRKRDRVFRKKIGRLSFDVSSKAWRKLRKSTKVYVVVTSVNGSKSSLRNAIIFVTRRKGGKTGPARGKVTVAMTNARAVKNSFWVRKVDRRGKATVFHVRNAIGTALGNWTRYLRGLGIARALRAAMRPVDVNGTFQNGRAAQAGVISRGGSKMSPTARSLFSLIFGTINDRVAFGAIKRSPIAPVFIAGELKNSKLAARWRDVVGKVPTLVPDKYAAASKEEAKFVRVAAPMISSRSVVISDFENASRQGAIETPRRPGDTVPGTPIAVNRAGTGSGTVTSDIPGIACPPDCTHFYTSGSNVILVATPDSSSEFAGWQGCTGGVDGNRCQVSSDALFVVPTQNVIATFNAKPRPPGPTSFRFQNTTSYPASAHPRGIAIARLQLNNGPAVAVTEEVVSDTTTNDSVDVFPAGAGGVLGTKVTRDLDPLSGPSALAAGTMGDGDSTPDLAVAEQRQPLATGAVSLLFNRGFLAPAGGTGAFSRVGPQSSGAAPVDLALADIDQNTSTDVAMVGSGGVYVQLDQGAASLSAPTTLATGSAQGTGIAAGDVNGDGKPDLVVADASLDGAVVLRNTTPQGNATPTFAPAELFFTQAGRDPSDVAVGDVTGDGKPDVVLANRGLNSISVLRNTTATGSTTLGFAQSTLAAVAGSAPSAVTLADFSGDGGVDIAAANSGTGNASVFVNRGVGGFGPPIPVQAGTDPRAIAAGDLNGDGRNDLAIANYGTETPADVNGTISVALNAGPSF